MSNIEIPNYVITDMEIIRKSGKYNMLNTQEVLNELFNRGCYKTLNWLFNEKLEKNSYASQFNSKKYLSALIALSEARYLAEYLSEN